MKLLEHAARKYFDWGHMITLWTANDLVPQMILRSADSLYSLLLRALNNLSDRPKKVDM